MNEIPTGKYFSRFQVKFRRRRERKTDYKARLNMLNQKKNTFNTYKYRLVVRFSNRDICSQITLATVSGDKVVCSAYGHELPSHGLKVGLTNFSAAYCVGLLCATRSKSKFALNSVYPKMKLSVGAGVMTETIAKGPRPFNLILDTGLKRTSTGSKLFGLLKGAVDGGVRIPHNEIRFVGFDNITKKNEELTLKKYIDGSHVRDLMIDLKEEEPNKFRLQFSTYINLQIQPEELSRLYEKVHESLLTYQENSHQFRPTGKRKYLFESEALRDTFKRTVSLKPKKHTHERSALALMKKLAALHNN